MREYIVPIYDDSPDHDEMFVGYIRENATEIVRCKDCIYWQDQKEGVVEVPICKYDCRGNKTGVVIVMGADDYCSRGERKSMRLIDTGEAFLIMSDYYHHRTEMQADALREALDRVPEAVVRCDKCRWHYDLGRDIVCAISKDVVRSDDYCSYGERGEA